MLFNSQKQNCQMFDIVISRVGNLLSGFLSNLLVSCEEKSNSLAKKSKSLPSLFCLERPERIPLGRSFVMCDLRESLTVTLLYRAMGTNRSSRSLKRVNGQREM